MPISTLIVSAAVSVGLRVLSSALQSKESTKFNSSLPDSSYRQPIPKIYNWYRVDGKFIEPFGSSQAFKTKEKGGKDVLRGTFHAVISQSATKFSKYYLNGLGSDNLHDVEWMGGAYGDRDGWNYGSLKFVNKKYYDRLKEETGREYNNGQVIYQGYTTIGFFSRNLSEYLNTNTFPTISVLHYTKEVYSLSGIIADICNEAGISSDNIDTTELEGIEPRGFMRPQNGGSYAEELAPLGLVYKFFATESTDGTLRFRKFERPGITLQIPWQDFIPQDDGFLWSESENDPLDLPRTVNISFPDPANKWLDNSVESDEYLEAVGQEQNTLEVPVVLSVEEAKEVANWQINQTWARQRSYSYKLPLKYVGSFEVGDILILPGGIQTQVENFTVGAGYTIEVNAVSYDSKTNSNIVFVNNSASGSTDTSSGYNNDDVTDPNVNDDGTINYGQLKMLDLPLAQYDHSELGFYVFSDRQGELYLDRGDGDKEEANLLTGSTFGVCQSILPSVDNFNLQAAELPIVIDDYLDVALTSGDLEIEISDLAFARQEQLAFVGRQVNGTWIGEYIGFQFVEELEEGRYRLSNFQRGLRGTEGYTNQHVSNEEFFLIAGSQAYWERIPIRESDIGQSWIGKLLIADAQDLATTPSTTLDVQARGIMPLPPTDVEIAEDPEGNLVFDFVPRSRGGRSLGEETERFAIDLLNSGSAVVRTLSGSNPLIYPQDQKTVDNLDSTEIDANIYKVSSIVGRGLVGLIRDLGVTGSSNTVIANSSEESKGFKYISSNHTVTADDSGYWLLVDTTAADIDITLTEISAVKFWVQNIGSNNVNFVGSTLKATDTVMRTNEAMELRNRDVLWYGLLSGRIDIPQHLIVYSDFTLSQIHHGKIVSVQSAQTVTVTLDESVLVNPQDFHTTIRKKGEGDIYFTPVSGSYLETSGTTLEVRYTAAYIGYEGNRNWIALGAFGTGGGGTTSAQVRTIAENFGTQTQAQLQSLYDAQIGIDAPDTVPQEVSDDAASGTGYQVYLGHNKWWYRNGGDSSWLQFNSVAKGDFGAAIAIAYTFK